MHNIIFYNIMHLRLVVHTFRILCIRNMHTSVLLVVVLEYWGISRMHNIIHIVLTSTTHSRADDRHWLFRISD
jgi:hypothetical protein